MKVFKLNEIQIKKNVFMTKTNYNKAITLDCAEIFNTFNSGSLQIKWKEIHQNWNKLKENEMNE